MTQPLSSLSHRLLAVFYSAGVLASLAVTAPAADGPYTADWDSLARHPAAPEWFQDAKFGIYFHWGVYSVPAFSSEWYPSLMNRPGENVYEYHTQTYGHPSTFGYHEFVDDFTAQHFDPDDWAQLFEDAGARFAGLVAEHHDGFSMWDSDATPWNAADKGPKRDILGELFKSLEARGMKTIATFHHARNLQRYPSVPAPSSLRDLSKSEGRSRGNSHYYNWAGWPTASEDPDLRRLYGNLPEDQWIREIWAAKLHEVVDQYRPDIIWFDSWLDQIPEGDRQAFCAYYLNAAARWDKDVVIVRKQDDLPLAFTVNDHEKSREPKAIPETWMTDDTISTGSWCYTQDLRIKPFHKVLHALIDTVSKNGVVLLNLSPLANGTIPGDQRAVLLQLGTWLTANGEAIYGTRTWETAAEGPTAEPGGGFRDRGKFLNLEYTVEDIRYTRSKDNTRLYAITLARPGPGSVLILRSVRSPAHSVQRVILLATGETIPHRVDPDGLHLTLPSFLPDSPAAAFRMELSPVQTGG